MARFSRLLLLFAALVLVSLLPVVSSSAFSAARRTASYAKYTAAHSLGDRYVFDERDGWTSVNVTDLNYKYRRQSGITTSLEPRHGNKKDDHKMDAANRKDNKKQGDKKDKKKQKHSNGYTKTVDGNKKKHKKLLSASSVGDAIDAVKTFFGLKGIGKQEDVTITWYTGHDLLYPSCWPNTDWAPTDQSFACALTLEGWITRPKCFKFLELCNGPKKCVFVRVIDSCAGCAPGSKHVDLTKGAFSQLADPDEGVLNVQMRGATDPTEWFLDLWGPEEKST